MKNTLFPTMQKNWQYYPIFQRRENRLRASNLLLVTWLGGRAWILKAGSTPKPTVFILHLKIRPGNKEDVVHIYNGILFSHKKEWNNAVCSNMDATRHRHTEWSESERQTLYDIICMWNLVSDTCTHAQSLQSCPALCNPMDWSPPGFSVHGILQTRVPTWPDTNELFYQTEKTHRHRKQACGCQGGGRWRRGGLGIWN